jgi:hypothetical protein
MASLFSPDDAVLAFTTIVVGAISVGVSFYVKDYLQKRSDYFNMKKKLDRIAGKNATVIYETSSGTGGMPGFAQQLYKIVEIDEQGVTLKNELQTVFVPTAKLLRSDMILPADDYETAKLAKMAKDTKDMMHAMVPAMVNEMFPELIVMFKEQMSDDKSEVSGVIAVKMQKVLEDEGYEIKKRTPPRLLSGKTSDETQ